MTPLLLDAYHAIERTSLQMVEAAQSDDWDTVARLELASRMQVAQLRELTQGIRLSTQEAAQKHRILLTILRHDAQVRRLADPSMAGLELLFHQQGPAQLH